jgi:hypothetical protein
MDLWNPDERAALWSAAAQPPLFENRSREDPQSGSKLPHSKALAALALMMP